MKLIHFSCATYSLGYFWTVGWGKGGEGVSVHRLLSQVRVTHLPHTLLQLPPLIKASIPATNVPSDKCCLKHDKQLAFQLLIYPTYYAKEKRCIWHVLKQMDNQHESYWYLLILMQLDVRLN